MTRILWDADGETRRALRFIVADPQFGTAALGNPRVMSNLLKDLLPDAPREAAVLVAAAQADLAGVLQGHLAQGLDLGTASRLAAAHFADGMPFTADACRWVVSELAIALGANPSAAAEETLPDTVPYSDVTGPDADEGRVIAWGDNDEGEITVPAGLSGVTAVAAGWYHSLALTAAGQVVAWGSDAHGLTDVPAGLTGVTAIAAGRYHSLALTAAGQVVAWGGTGSARGGEWGQADVPAGLTGVTAIAAGADRSLAVADGRVVAWGRRYGHAGVPAGLTGVTAIAASETHGLALTTSGEVIGWGLADQDGTDVPAGLTGVTAIAAGLSHCLALTSDGEVVAWGSSDYGGTDVPAGLSGVACIASSGVHSLALTAGGAVVAWGGNECGECDVPPGLFGVTAIAAGYGHSLAVVSDAI
jgi:alpha-tubulin suppressor-like RCC1 family protein